MDLDEANETGRREGALALVTLASQCPRLRALSLFDFDFGTIPGDDPSNLPSLESVEELARTPGRRTPGRRAVGGALAHVPTPHLQVLTIVNPPGGSHIDPLPTMPTVRRLSYMFLYDISQFPHLLSLLVVCPGLRELKLNIACWSEVEEDIPAIIRQVPLLESLTLSTPEKMRHDALPRRTWPRRSWPPSPPRPPSNTSTSPATSPPTSPPLYQSPSSHSRPTGSRGPLRVTRLRPTRTTTIRTARPPRPRSPRSPKISSRVQGIPSTSSSSGYPRPVPGGRRGCGQ